MTIQIIRRPAGSGDVCREILATVPQWFGIPESNAEYTALAETGPAWLAEEDGEAVGLMILKPHGADAWEIYFLAVRSSAHRQGVGRALVEAAVHAAGESGARYLTVKTQGPSADYEPYARTRAFYSALGFAALEEFLTIWGPENPALFMVMPVERG